MSLWSSRELADNAKHEVITAVTSIVGHTEARGTPGVDHTMAIAGQSILMNANAPNFGAMYVMLDEFHHRAANGLSGPRIAAELQQKLQDEIRDGLVNVFDAPPVDGLGTAGGFKIVVQDRGDLGPNEIESIADSIVEDSRNPRNSQMLQGLFTSFRANTPWLYLDIDRDKAKLAGVSISELFNTLQVYLGSLYVNDFNRFGRTWQVNVQGAADFRKQINDLTGLRVRNGRGAMVPLGSVAKIRDVSGPVMLIRYNLYPSATINLNPRPASARARQSRRWSVWSSPSCRRRCGRNGRSWRSCSSRPGQRRCMRSRWRSCWSSWCWRRSMRAGRCRWR